MRSEQAKSSRSSRGEAKKHTSTIAPISLEDLMEKEVLVCFFASPRLDREDFACSLRMMLSVKGCKKGKRKG